MKKKPTKLLNLANADRASYENKNRSLYRHVNTHTHVCTSYSPWEKASFLYWSLTRSFLGRHTYLLAVTWTIQALTSLWLFPLAGILPLVPPAPISPRFTLLLHPNICLNLTLFTNILFWNNFSFTENFQR